MRIDIVVFPSGKYEISGILDFQPGVSTDAFRDEILSHVEAIKSELKSPKLYTGHCDTVTGPIVWGEWEGEIPSDEPSGIGLESIQSHME